ncbi:TetR/AcrR family transcriptional regulator [Viridibacillus arvi]|uniref:TetR family transcriptional regulator n=1 Tax=Viridibacillus arvi TaxID=263475 RepID=A0A0M0LKD7_9BACL|nr:TetR/AcrR family transcriptional regulator [Viridibacillus arvi]KOO51540.1 TetR family transcriptional regulator [Viridibacillus arvi]
MNFNDKKVDLRVRRTYKLLWEALEELLSQPGQEFNSITVNQICDKAMVHRTTFYKHFEDKYDLLYFGIEQFNEKYVKVGLEERVLKPFQSFEMVPNLELFDNIIQSNKNDEIFNNYMNYRNKETLKYDFLELNNRGENFSVPIEIIVEFYSGALSSLSAWWIQNGRKVPAKQMDQYFHEMINKEFFSSSK